MRANVNFFLFCTGKMNKNKVLNLRDKINDNEVDLSLSNLTEVPVKELVNHLPVFLAELEGVHSACVQLYLPC